MESDFGAWLKKFRDRLGVSLEEFAYALGLKSRHSVWQAEQKPKRVGRGGTEEGIMYLAGCATAEDLDRMVADWRFPPLAEVAKRFEERWAIYCPGMPSPLLLGTKPPTTASADFEAAKVALLKLPAADREALISELLAGGFTGRPRKTAARKKK